MYKGEWKKLGREDGVKSSGVPEHVLKEQGGKQKEDIESRSEGNMRREL